MNEMTVVRLAGDLTAASVIQLAQTLIDVRRREPKRVIVDLKSLKLLDTTGFSFLRASIRYFRNLGVDLQIKGLSPMAVALNSLYGADNTLLKKWMEGGQEQTDKASKDILMSDQHHQTREAKMRASRSTILVVDDEEQLIHYLDLFLSYQGYTVLTARNEAEAVSRLVPHSGDVRLALVDYSLGQENGLDVVAALVAIEPEIGIILTSGCPIEDLEHREYPNIKACLQKPFYGGQLVALILELTGSRTEINPLPTVSPQWNVKYLQSDKQPPTLGSKSAE